MPRAVIFDLDGVISDTQPRHAAVEAALLREHGIALAPGEITERYAGVVDRQFFGELFAAHGVVADVEAVVAEKWRRMGDAAHGPVRPIPGALPLIAALRAAGARLAVASASPPAFIAHVLEGLGVADRFDAVASALEVARGKPDPAVFLLAASRLGVSPLACVVIEDGVSGMVAARRAGMACVGLAPPGRAVPADLVVHDLRHLDPARLLGLAGRAGAPPADPPVLR